MSYQDLISDKIIKCPSLYKINIDHTRDNFDLSSEEDGSKSPTKKFEKIFKNNFETYYNTLMIDNKIIKKKAMYNDYEITSFNFFIMNKNLSENSINAKNNKDNKKNNKDTKKRGRKRKREETDDNDTKIHNKFSDDNLRKKCKNIVLKSILEFINKKIKEQYNNKIGHGKFKKEFKILDQEKKVKSTVSFEKSFLNKTLKEIFSSDISARFYNFPRNYNKLMIESLIKDIDEERRKYFIKLFDITFIDCLKYFREDKEALNIGELNGLKQISSIKEELITEHGNEYFEIFINYLQNFEDIINNKRARKRRKKIKSRFKLLINEKIK
jgi:hypothetical protein